MAHVVAGDRGVVAGVWGGEPATVSAGEDLEVAWEEVSRAVAEITGDPEETAKELDGPLGTMAAGQVIGRLATLDLLAHTWDLARAVGAAEHLDEDAVHHAYEILEPMDAAIRRPGTFGPKVAQPPGADAQTVLLCFLGRRV